MPQDQSPEPAPQRRSSVYAQLRASADPAAQLSALDDEDVVGAMALAAREPDERLVDLLGAEALERAQKRARTLESLRLHRLLVASVVDYAIFALDVDGKVRTWNAGAERLKGYAPAEILGRRFTEFYTPQDRADGLPDRLLREAVENGHVEHEGWRLRKDGSHFWARVTITALRGEDGALRGFAKVTRDLTERRAAEEALRSANEELERKVAQRTHELEETVRRLRAANDSLQAFSYVVSHDLKEPVRGIDALLDAMRADQGHLLDAEGRETLDHAIRSARRLAGLVTDLLEWSNAGRGDPSRAIRVLVAEAFAADATRVRFDHLATERGATFDVRLRADHAVRASPAALSLILGNLVLNAIRHNPKPDPLVRVRSELHEDDAQGRIVELIVEDNGPGFSEESLRAFDAPDDPDLAPRGNGFGLAIVRRAVERFGGRLRVERSPEGGASVHVRLPAA